MHWEQPIWPGQRVIIKMANCQATLYYSARIVTLFTKPYEKSYSGRELEYIMRTTKLLIINY